jgi:hypothetical protein
MPGRFCRYSPNGRRFLETRRGLSVCIAAALAFYFRLSGQKKRASNGIPAADDYHPEMAPGYGGEWFRLPWPLMASPGYFPTEAQPYWWIPVTLGILVFLIAV